MKLKKGSEECCFFCKYPSTSRCNDCRLVSFCDNEAHKSVHYDASSDKIRCFPFKILSSPELGRFMVATRDIKAMEVILKERPVIVGPYPRSDKTQCLECSTILKNPYPCIHCNYPLCSEECSKGVWHRLECTFFQKYDHKKTNPSFSNGNGLISIIRVLAQEYERPEIWCNIINDMVDHNEQIRVEMPEKWRFYSEAIECIRDMTKGEYGVDLIERIVGVLDTNGADLNVQKDISLGQKTGLYLTYSNINHSCVCNTKTTHFSDHRLEMRASVDIKKGDQICNQYVRPNKATLSRRLTIRNKWYFDCLCIRCSDPTECESYLGAMLCDLCESTVLSSDPLDYGSIWKCTKCSKVFEPEYVMNLIMSTEDSLESKVEDFLDWNERILYDTSSMLHSNHYLRIEAETRLALYIGNVPSRSSFKTGVSRPELERKKQCCLHVLAVLSKVDLGFNAWRVKILSEIIKTKLYIAHEDFMKGLVDESAIANVIKEQKMLEMYTSYNQAIFLGNR